MKRVIQFVMLTVVMVSVGAGAYVASPALRAKVARESQSLLGWTEAARQADPVGFTEFVEHQLRNDLNELKLTRRDLAMEAGTLAKKEKEQRDLLVHAEQFAAEYRAAYQQATEADAFPVSIRHADYSADEVVSQVSLLLAEADGYRQTLGRLSNIRQQAEQQLEQLAVRINTTETQLATTATQRGLLRARVLSDEGERLVAQVDLLLNNNSVVIHSNPVRSVRELLASNSTANQQRPSLEVARQFLMTQGNPEETVEAEIERPQKKPQDDITAAEPTSILLKPNLDSTPIFQQH